MTPTPTGAVGDLLEADPEARRSTGGDGAGDDVECFKRATTEAVVRAQHQDEPRP